MCCPQFVAHLDRLHQRSELSLRVRALSALFALPFALLFVYLYLLLYLYLCFCVCVCVCVCVCLCVLHCFCFVLNLTNAHVRPDRDDEEPCLR